MATTTPNFGWAVPTSTDLVKDGAVAIETLGDSIDASLLDLKGGTTGQVLAKATNTDMDFTWVAQDDSNAIQNAIVDAKGDIIAATADNTPARLAVGTANQVLTVDSTTATGLKWATPAAGSFNTGFASVGTSESTTSTSYTNLTTTLSTTVTTGTKALVTITVGFQNGAIANVGSFASFDVTGATTLAASDTYATRFFAASSSNLLVNGSGTWVVTGLTAGSNVFTAKYKSESGVLSNFVLRTISVVNLGS